jgi:hypothetical protein
VALSDHPDVGRRQALQRLAAGAVGAAGAGWVESLSALARVQAHAGAAHGAQAAADWTPRVLTSWQNEAVTALAELIIPATDTPGAKAAGVNRFIDQVLRDAPAAERSAFFRGLAWMDNRSKVLFGKDLVSASPQDQTYLLTRVSSDPPDEADHEGADFFRVLKSMTISGYYSSEIGLRQELGDDGQLFQPEFKGCDHPEHQP